MKVWSQKAMLVFTRLNLQRTIIQIMTGVFYRPLRHLHLQSRSRQDAEGSSLDENFVALIQS